MANGPRVTVDVVLFTLANEPRGRQQRLCVLLWRRDHPPFQGYWALPGQGIALGESLEGAAQRVLHGVASTGGVYLEQLYTFGEPDRDPRGRVVTVAYYALVRADQIRLRTTATVPVAWFPVDALPAELAFDHGHILDYARWRLRSKIEYTDIAFQFLPERFSLTHLRQVYEAVGGQPLDKRNFNRKILGSGLVMETGAVLSGQAHRPARLYSFIRQKESPPMGTPTPRPAADQPPAEPGSALLLVDVQNDFCPGGALAVPEGDAVVPVLNRWIAAFAAARRPIFASRDWHPAASAHFQAGGGPWPPHCIQATPGAAFHPALKLPETATVLSKGTDPAESGGYSAFEAADETGVTLGERLRQAGVTHLYVGGLATDYCVRASVLDARQAGLAVTVIGEAVRGVEVKPGDSARALAEMRAAGAVVSA